MRTALRLVWVAPASDDSRTPSGNKGKRPGNGHPGIPTVLVVEDEILIRFAIADHLRDEGLRVIEASSAEEAQAVFKTDEPIEILFSDVDLGRGMSGVALATWVRETYPDVRILLTSGKALLDPDQAALSDGPFLNKPYASQDVTDHIKRLLGLLGRQSGQ